MTTSKKILLVDDDVRNIFALTAVLKSRGYFCRSAPDGMEGLKILSTADDIGLVLLDMMMPDMDGYEMMAKIRESEQRHLPIVAVTAQAMVGDREKCIAAGADAYLAKPINVDALMILIQKYLHG